jgi:hypothetical protein
MNLSTSSSNLKKAWMYFFWSLLFILFLFVFDRGFYYIISHLEVNVFKDSNFEERLAKYVKGKNISTLIFGTSRTYEGIHPHYIGRELNETAFKVSFQGKGPKYNYYFYNLYKKYAGVPKVVIYGVDYFLYAIRSTSLWMSNFNLIDTQKENFLNLSSPLLLLKHKKRYDILLNNLIVWLEKEMTVPNQKDSTEEFYKVQKYIGVDDPNKKLVTQPPANFTYQQFLRFPGKEGRYFKRLLTQLDKDNVTVVLVALPDYIGSLKTNYQHRRFIKHLRRLKKNYKNVFIYNYNNYRKFPLDNPEFFNDGGYGKTNSHLSKRGARLFNEVFIKDLKKHYQR